MKNTSQFQNLGQDTNKRILLHLYQDGLFDVLGALMVGLFGLIPILDGTGMEAWLRQLIYLGAYATGLIAILWLKRSVSAPRAGHMVMMKQQKQGILRVLLWVNLAVFACFLFLWIFKRSGLDFLGSYQLPLSLGLVFLLMFSVAGLLLKAHRFHFWGLLVLCFFLLGSYLYSVGSTGNNGIPLAAFGSGSIIASWGGGLFLRFLKNNPKAGTDEGY